MNTYEEFKQQWNGQRVDFDHILGWQCVDLIRQYMYQCYGLTNTGGVPTAIAYWSVTPSAILDKFDRLQTTDCRQGDIVMLRTLGRNDFAGDGHIGICDAQDAVNVWLLEQNQNGSGSGQGRDAIGVWRAVPKTRIAGVLRPKQVSQPAQPAVVIPKFQVVEEYPQGKRIKLNKQPTNLWGMNYDFDFMKDHPVEVHNQEEVWTVTNKVHHVNGYDYYRREGQVDGFNVLDCDDYVEPPVYIAPAPPIKGQEAEKYDLVTTVKYFDTYADVVNDTNAKGTKPKKTYFVRTKKGTAYELADDNMTNTTFWIDVKDNVDTPKVEVLPPKVAEAIKTAALQVPQPIPETPVEIPQARNWEQEVVELRKHLSLFNTDGSPEYYYSINTVDVDVFDMSGRPDPATGKDAYVTLKAHTKHIPMVGTIDIEDPDGNRMRYGLPEKFYNTGQFYLAPMRFFRLKRKGVLDTVVDAFNDIKASEYLTAAEARIKLAIQGFNARMKKK